MRIRSGQWAGLLLNMLCMPALAQVTSQTVRGEDMATTPDVLYTSSPTGLAVELRDNSATLSTVITLGERPPYLVTASGAGDFGGGAWPQAFLEVDGTISNWPVTFSSASYLNYVFMVRPPSGFVLDGMHTFTIAFMNDFDGGSGNDRNLYVDTLDFLGTAASQPSTVPLTLGATQMGYSNGPGLYRTDPDGPLWEMLSNGYVEEPLAFSQGGDHTFTFTARTDADPATLPQVELALDGDASPLVTVDAAGLTSYRVTRAVSAGTHAVRLSYVNNPVQDDAAPNLFLGALSVEAVPVTPAPPPPPPTGPTPSPSVAEAERYRVGFGCSAAGPEASPLLLGFATALALAGARRVKPGRLTLSRRASRSSRGGS